MLLTQACLQTVILNQPDISPEITCRQKSLRCPSPEHNKKIIKEKFDGEEPPYATAVACHVTVQCRSRDSDDTARHATHCVMRRTATPTSNSATKLLQTRPGYKIKVGQSHQII